MSGWLWAAGLGVAWAVLLVAGFRIPGWARRIALTGEDEEG